jgi:hypothetical protein
MFLYSYRCEARSLMAELNAHSEFRSYSGRRNTKLILWSELWNPIQMNKFPSIK